MGSLCASTASMQHLTSAGTLKCFAPGLSFAIGTSVYPHVVTKTQPLPVVAGIGRRSFLKDPIATRSP